MTAEGCFTSSPSLSSKKKKVKSAINLTGLPVKLVGWGLVLPRKILYCQTHLHEFICLESHRGLNNQMPVIHVVLERRDVDFTERHVVLQKKTKRKNKWLFYIMLEILPFYLNKIFCCYLVAGQCLCRFGHFGIHFGTLNIWKKIPSALMWLSFNSSNSRYLHTECFCALHN